MPGAGGGLPLAIRWDHTKRMATRGGDEGELIAAGRSERRSKDARDGGQQDEDPRDGDGEDYTGVSSEFNALCQVQFSI